ncbi:hypothetical protein [Streptomyces melanogenes]|uniref:hypothetical protein n=1 Tax=Streptomyces melanogenes TaxID=67326 RepID=UPI00167D912B|nr:hypothetical protein [Streptomyces melanogenes]GGP82316.1 hypothetical protein GCM10010278_71170 [Streptomyces melanogenes]
MTTARRRLGDGPQTPQAPATPTAEPRPRIIATQADLDTGPMDQVQLPDLAELRARGVLGDAALEE